MRNDSQNKSSLKLVSQPQEFFHELVTEALGRQSFTVQAETEFYLVNLLNQFMSADNLYVRNSEGQKREEPLALMVKEALETPSPSQAAMFRKVGDVSLYMAGFFQDSLTRKLVDVDYYIEMGGTAYQNVAHRADEDLKRKMYLELAHKFGSFVDVLAEVGDKTGLHTEKDVLRKYELWTRTRNERAARVLQGAGIITGDPKDTKDKN